MATRALNHVGITVSDLDRSLAFYCGIAGMELFSRRRMQGQWFDTLTHNEGADIDVAMVRLDGFVLQLVQYLAAGGASLDLAHHHPGNPHLCIDVDDVDAHHRRANDESLEPTPIVDILGSGIRSFYVDDPDGVPVEFLQMR
jgi:glyoxylase I family protein